MRLETLILADAVSSPPDGKFYVLGGGITRINLLELPTLTQLGLFVRFQFDEDEPLDAHQVKIQLLDPEGEDILKGAPEVTIPPLTNPPPLAEGEQRFVALAVNLNAIPIRREGLHRFRVSVDGGMVREVPLPATGATAAPGHVGPFLLRDRQPGP